MNSFFSPVSARFLLLLMAVPAFAELRVANLLTDHMVVQRGMPVHVWGSGAPGEVVTVTFRGASASGKADDLGLWSVWLPSGQAGGPFEMLVRGSRTIRLEDIYTGDVWIAAGQSNMEWPIRWAANPEAEKAAASYPKIRLVRTMHRVRDYPVDEFYGTSWELCSPKSVEHFSAVGYHFAREIQRRTNVTIGVIQSAWGGTPAEAWTSLQGISSDATLMPIFTEWAKVTEGHEANLRAHRMRLDEWARAAAKAKQTGAPEPEKPELRTGPAGPWTPAGLFNGMLSPLTRLPIRGVIWYQGESNTSSERAPLYERLFPTMIRDWRRAWGQGDFPFLFVQLANYTAAPDSMWPELREAQGQTLGVANTAMAVTIDIGTPSDIHPKDKKTVGQRLALAARALAYGEKIEYMGPLSRQTNIEGPAIRVWFDHAAGLMSRGGPPRGFEIAGADRRFVPAQARIDGNTVVVTADAVPKPVVVRYAWADNPQANLYNSAGLPASPFRSRR